MLPKGIAYPAQLNMLTSVLEAYCKEHRIESIRDRENAAALVMSLFQNGYCTPAFLKEALDLMATQTRH